MTTQTETLALAQKRRRIPFWRGAGLKKSGLTVVVFGFLALLILAPIAALLVKAFTDDVTGGFTFGNFGALTDGTARSALWNSLWVTALATVGAVVVGGGLAWLVERTDVPFKGFVRIAGVVPMFFSALVGTLAWALLGSPGSGYINTAIHAMGIPITFDVQSWHGIVFVLVLYYAPFAFMIIQSAFALSSGDMENASRISGASSIRTTLSISFPLVLPSVVGASILVFVIMSENFPVTSILGAFAHMDFVPSFMYVTLNKTPAQPGVAAALGVIVLCITWVAIWAESRFVLRRSYVTVGGKGARASLVRLGWWKWVGLAAAVLYIILAAVLPVLALTIAALRRTIFHKDLADLLDPSKLSLDGFAKMLGYDQFGVGLWNSIQLAVLTALIGTILTFIAAYVARRKMVHGHRLIEYMSLAPVAIPGLILGLAFLEMWVGAPIAIYGTIWILTFAYVCQLFPFGYESMSGTIVKLDNELEDSAVLSGASRIRAILAVTLPVMKGALGASFLLLFVLTFREFTVALFLYTPDTTPLSIVIYGQWVGGSVQLVAAMSLVFTAVLLFVTVINRMLIRNRS